jgi:hypothetical protein
MTDAELQDFVTRFAAAWAARDGNAFLDLWLPEGTLKTPMVGRAVKGSELNRLLEVQKAAAPDFVWQLLDWTSRGDVVIIEWQTTRMINGARFDWRGVDKFRIRDGRSRRRWSIATPRRCGPSVPAKRWSRLRSSRSALFLIESAHRHPEVRAKRASKDRCNEGRLRPILRGAQERAPQDDARMRWLLIESVLPSAHFTSPLVGEVGSHRSMRSG